ncbi:DUF262 domain-containing protein [Arthrobacter zhaoguopingii]|uniref:DUF262 domain-containing protein n=1 Tax=Arthrobacter zhaoguopingii TaxID=2681491 RepID=UPI001358C70A|nr:DUF262 domain-containing protein [Arthrobacter zhaoguopingii]
MADLISTTVNVGKLFDRENFFRIPDYQRPFSWSDDNLSDLIGDLIEAPKNSDYFLGTLVLHKVGVEGGVSTFDVVDGQQRLTALCILLACLRDSEAFVGDQDMQGQIQDKLLQREQSLSGIPARNRLHVRDLEAFNNIVIKAGGAVEDDSVDQLLGYGERKYRAAAKAFRERLSALPAQSVIELARFILQRCVVVYLAASSFEEAFRLFTIVNDRGQQLRRVDILKANNLAPSVVPDPSVRAHYADKWEGMEEKVGADRFEDIFHSLRLIYTQDKPKADLLKEFEDRILGKPGMPTKGSDFLDRLGEYVDIYDSLFISCDYLAGTPNSEKFETMMSAMVSNFVASEWRAVVLQFARKFGKADLYAFLLLVEKVFLEQWVGGMRKDERYSTYTSMLKSIEVSKRSKAVLDNIEFDGSAIEEACRSPRFYGAGYSKYLLLRAEICASELSEARKFSVRSVEHVLPQNPAAESQWRVDFSQSDIDSVVHSAGNLVLLSKGKNSSAQNKDFVDKKNTYLSPRVTDFPRSVQVLSEQVWTRAVIEQRTLDFASSVLVNP